jgi:hypothetical protein
VHLCCVRKYSCVCEYAPMWQSIPGKSKIFPFPHVSCYTWAASLGPLLSHTDPWCILDTFVVVTSVFLLISGSQENSWVKQVAEMLNSGSLQNTHGMSPSVVHRKTSCAAGLPLSNTILHNVHMHMRALIYLQAHHAADAYPTGPPAASCIPEGRRSPQDHNCRLDEHRARPPGPGKDTLASFYL